MERSYFPSHTRGDSVASEDSTHSFTMRYGGKSAPFGHSSQSSIATATASTFTKKPSFASIRNAFKKNNDAPPVPHLDQQPYPALRNPFNRSTSSLNHAPSPTGRNPLSSFTSNAMSPPYHRPPTPTARGPPVRSKSHGYVKSHHSQSGSLFHASDGGSDHGHYPFSSSPPPVPRVPNAFGGPHSSEPTPIADFDDDKIVMDPKTPSDYALHAVFIRFATSSESKIDMFLRQILVRIISSICF